MHHSNHTIICVTFFHFQYHPPHVKILVIDFIFILQKENLWFFGPSPLLNIRVCPLMYTTFLISFSQPLCLQSLNTLQDENTLSFPNIPQTVPILFYMGYRLCCSFIPIKIIQKINTLRLITNYVPFLPSISLISIFSSFGNYPVSSEQSLHMFSNFL